MTSPNSLLPCFTLTAQRRYTSVRTLLPHDTQVATGTYEALCSIVHEAQLEALLVLKGLCQGVTQVVRGQRPLSALLELGENTLKKGARTGSDMDKGVLCVLKAPMSQPLLRTKAGNMTRSAHMYFLYLDLTFNAQKIQESP